MVEPGAFTLTREAAEVVARRLSVVAINYEGRDIIEQLIAGVWASEAPPLELVVVDNGSTDGSRELLRGRDDVVLVEPEGNLGFGGGCMAGARAARGDLLLFLNPDVELTPDMLGALVTNMLANPAVAVSFPKQVEPWGAHAREPWLEDVSTSSGAVMLTSRAHLEALGGFDPRIFLYFEETDFCWRTRLAGRRVIQDWQAVAIHESHGAGGGPRWAAEQIRNGLLVHVKTRPWPAVGRFAAAMVVKTVLRGAQYRDARVLSAWTDNLRRLPEMLADRRRIRGAADETARAELEVLCLAGSYWQRYFRRRRLRNALVARLPRMGRAR